jgi:hypothetical protein
MQLEIRKRSRIEEIDARRRVDEELGRYATKDTGIRK